MRAPPSLSERHGLLSLAPLLPDKKKARGEKRQRGIVKERGRKKKHRSTIVFLFLLSLLQDSCFHHGCCAPRRAPVEAVGAGAGSPSRGAWVAAVSWTRRESGVGVERLRGQWFFLHQMTDASCIFPPLSLPGSAAFSSRHLSTIMEEKTKKANWVGEEQGKDF